MNVHVCDCDRYIGGFYIKTWISTLLKMSLNVLGTSFTGGVMNPAFAMGWVFAREDHVTEEHLMVYWFEGYESACN